MRAPAKSDSLLRLSCLCAILLAELLTISVWLDGSALAGRPGLLGQIGLWGAWILRFLVGFAAAFAAFAGIGGTLSIGPLTRPAPLRWTMVALHVASAAIFGILSAAIYSGRQLSTPDIAAVAWIAGGLIAPGSLALAFYPPSAWIAALRPTGFAWIYAAAVSGLGVAMVALSQSLWQSAARLTFELVQLLLRPVLPNLIVQPERMRLQGHSFGVIISQECSGLEGIGLMLVFSAAWLWLSRRDFRFPRAYLLIPAGILTLYFLNAVRIAALLLIGDAGAPQIAAGGFHSQAGWIAFNGVAFGMTLVVPRLQWFSLRSRFTTTETHRENPTAAYLVPFLAILATGMLTRAASAEFEWLYGLRFLAAAVAVFSFRKRLGALDWRFGPWGVLAGVVVFAVWLAFDQQLAIPAASMPAALAQAPSSSRLLWITLRALAAVTTVPIAEELAFRGFVMRRISSADFESVPFQASSWSGVALSSLVFGLLHGDRWIAGVFAGLAFALVTRRTGRIGDAVAAHAVANALLAGSVLYFDQWQYW